MAPVRPAPFSPVLLPRQQGELRAPKPSLLPWAASSFAIVSVAAPSFGAESDMPPRAPIDLDEAAESRLIGGKNKPGFLVLTHEAEGAARTRISVHGVNGSPRDVAPLNTLGPRLGENTITFAYDDRFRRLEHSAKDLARSIGEWRTAHPDRELVIDAHSMGGRVALAALAELAKTTELGPIHLNLIAVPLAGYEGANWARVSPAFLRGLIPVTRPGVDMGTSSRFQKSLNELVLPPSVKTTIFVAGKDQVVDGADAHPAHIVSNLNAEVVHYPDEDHVSIVARVAERLAGVED